MLKANVSTHRAEYYSAINRNSVICDNMYEPCRPMLSEIGRTQKNITGFHLHKAAEMIRCIKPKLKQQLPGNGGKLNRDTVNQGIKFQLNKMNKL